MSQNLPGLPDILREVRAFIDSITPAIPEHERYHALCCSYLLAVAERELDSGAEAAAENDAARLALATRAGLALPGDAELAACLRTGALDAHWDAALQAVMRQVVARVKISKPTHLDPEHQERVS